MPCLHVCGLSSLFSGFSLGKALWNGVQLFLRIPKITVHESLKGEDTKHIIRKKCFVKTDSAGKFCWRQKVITMRSPLVHSTFSKTNKQHVPRNCQSFPFNFENSLMRKLIRVCVPRHIVCSWNEMNNHILLPLSDDLRYLATGSSNGRHCFLPKITGSACASAF